ncbi:hypothetical protein D3C73_1230380 [compost metagenome]
MIQEAGSLILHILAHQPLLVQHRLAQHRLPVGIRVFQREYPGHIQAVEPHLVRIFVLMPISALGRPVHRPQQIPQLLRSYSILLQSGPLLQREQQQPGLNRIQLVAGKIQIAVIIHQIIHISADVVDIAVLSGSLPQHFHPAQKNTLMVVPAPGRRKLSCLISIH